MERDFSIDILKFLAVFLIINSHMDALYVHYRFLATGGAIGDAIFLFCSGYTLLLSKKNLRFDNWYKRRIARIYPSVIICALVGALLQLRWDVNIVDLAGGQFVIAIMVYYIIIYFIKQYAVDKLPLIIGGVVLLSILVYLFFFPYKYDTGEKGLYGISTLYRWVPYLNFMLLGSYVGLKHGELKYMPLRDFFKMAFCIVVFYGIQLGAKVQPQIAPWQIVTIFPLMGIVYYLYKWCNAGFWKRLYDTGPWHAIIMTISGLCLESYLIQYSVFTTKMNNIFPLNLLIMIAIVLMVAFICKCLARIFTQTFGSGDYNWKDVIKPY